MRYRLLGHSGLRVSELCLGTMTFGEDWGWGSSKEESRQVYDAFLEAGGNFIDTANVYTNGTQRDAARRVPQGPPGSRRAGDQVHQRHARHDPNAAGNHRKSMVQAVEASLKRLQTDYIDLYWLHIWDRITPIEEVMRAFDDLVRQGKILYAGVSDMPAWAWPRPTRWPSLRGWTPFVGLQIEYSLIERTPSGNCCPWRRTLGLGVTAWSPLAGGVLTGKQLEAGGISDSRQSNPMMQEFHDLERSQGGHRPRGRGRGPRERPFAGPGCFGLAAAAGRAGDPDHRGTEAGAGQGQHRLGQRDARPGPPGTT